MSGDWQDDRMDEVDELIARLSQPTEEELRAAAKERREREERERFNRLFDTPQTKRVFEQIDEFINGKDGLQGRFSYTSPASEYYAELYYSWSIKGIFGGWASVFRFHIDPNDGSYSYRVFVPADKRHQVKFEEFTDLGQALAVLEDRVEKARWAHEVEDMARFYGYKGIFPRRMWRRKAKRRRRQDERERNSRRKGGNY
jgi:hypothetical protein